MFCELTITSNFTFLTGASHPEEYMNRAGYALLGERNYSEALRAFKENAANYPDSANVYDSLGECHEIMGNKKKARANYEKALEIAIRNDDRRMVRSYKTRLEKLL